MYGSMEKMGLGFRSIQAHSIMGFIQKYTIFGSYLTSYSFLKLLTNFTNNLFIMIYKLLITT